MKTVKVRANPAAAGPLGDGTLVVLSPKKILAMLGGKFAVLLAIASVCLGGAALIANDPAINPLGVWVCLALAAVCVGGAIRLPFAIRDVYVRQKGRAVWVVDGRLRGFGQFSLPISSITEITYDYETLLGGFYWGAPGYMAIKIQAAGSAYSISVRSLEGEPEAVLQHLADALAARGAPLR